MYPVLDIYETVQGEGIQLAGYRTGLIRFGTLKEWSNAHLQSNRPAEYKELTLDEIVATCLDFKSKWVHLTGDDPCLTDLPALVRALTSASKWVSLDTSGAFMIDEETRNLLGFLSVGPKPGLPLHMKVYEKATELRFYLSSRMLEFESLLNRVNPPKQKTLVIPYSLDEQDIQYTLDYCIENDWRFHIPTYRAVPTFDAYRNGGEICKICLINDQPATEVAYPGLNELMQTKDTAVTWGPCAAEQA